MTIEHDTSCVALLAQADLLLLAADLLRPAPESRARLLAVGPSDLNGLAAAAELPGGPVMATALQAALETLPLTDAEAACDEYHRLFEGAMLAPLNETAIVRRDKGAVLGDLAGYYRAFGWAPESRGGEKADHLVTELEFAALLLAMLAQARSLQRAGDAHETRQALASFAVEHLGCWLPAACARIEECAAIDLYRCAGAAVAQVWQALVAAHGWAVVSVESQPPIDAALDEGFAAECGVTPAQGAGPTAFASDLPS